MFVYADDNHKWRQKRNGQTKRNKKKEQQQQFCEQNKETRASEQPLSFIG